MKIYDFKDITTRLRMSSYHGKYRKLTDAEENEVYVKMAALHNEAANMIEEQAREIETLGASNDIYESEASDQEKKIVALTAENAELRALLERAHVILREVFPCGSAELAKRQPAYWAADNERLVFAPTRALLKDIEAARLLAREQTRTITMLEALKELKAIPMTEEQIADYRAKWEANKERDTRIDAALAKGYDRGVSDMINGPKELCSDCPPIGYITDETRCNPCPRKAARLLASGDAP